MWVFSCLCCNLLSATRKKIEEKGKEEAVAHGYSEKGSFKILEDHSKTH